MVLFDAIERYCCPIDVDDVGLIVNESIIE